MRFLCLISKLQLLCPEPYADKKICFLIFKEIHKGAVAQSYMINGLLIYD